MTEPSTVHYHKGFYSYRRLLHYLHPYWGWFLLGILGTILLANTDAGLIWFLKPLLNKAFVNKDEHFIHLLPFILMIAFLMRSSANFSSSYCLARVARSVVMNIRQDILIKLLRLPTTFYDKTTSGQLLSTIIYNVDQVANASTDALITLVQESFFVLGLIIVMLMASWQLSVLFFITVPCMVWIARYSSRRMRSLNSAVQESMSEMTQVAEEVIDGYKVIRMFGGEDYEIKKFKKLLARNRFRELKVVVTNSLASSGVQLIAGAIAVVTIYLAISHLTHITAGGFTSLVSAMLLLLKPMRNLAAVNNIIQRGIAAAGSIFLLLDEKNEPDEGTHTLNVLKGHLECRKVSFAYLSEQLILQDIRFTIKPGETIALVGRSGSGKSTLVNLLPRFYDNYLGNILIDGMDIREIKLKDLRNQFALVSQHVVLFNDTIAHNIAYGQLSHVSEATIVRAAQAAHAMEFIEQLPQGLNTLIGENGVLLSGGQRQRIAIARALLKNAPFLILDEATSALDTEAERHIQAALEKLMQNRTTFVIAHRLSTVERAKQILVLDAGQIIERGTHQELLEKNGYYAKLYSMQFRDC
ncbi:lipid A export permease/ATP-binding protein MsbA [Rickettsiella grylli]|uniref:lipid A export permease/ATP-binding protein MsbA n=1 Tax=Rickettsiella grylli TaxID=59196 RepID=UPI0000DAE64F|nr:lipid A export permease/ATP-binding protein MsbA [Rickettsiella grylli]